jgi:hypothetical protein
MAAYWLRSSKGGGRSRRATVGLAADPWFAMMRFWSITAHHSPLALRFALSRALLWCFYCR